MTLHGAGGEYGVHVNMRDLNVLSLISCSKRRNPVIRGPSSPERPHYGIGLMVSERGTSSHRKLQYSDVDQLNSRENERCLKEILYK